jgi:opacity protein-like surface antigen
MKRIMAGTMLRKPLAGQQVGGSRPALIIVGAVSVLALPSAVLAFSTRFDMPPPDFAANQGMGAFAPGQADPRLARAIANRPQGKGPLYRFTPAGLATRPDRSVTVAVRVDAETARAIVVRAPSASSRAIPNVAVLRIAPAAYSLGLSRGYQNFAGNAQTYTLPGVDMRKQDTPDLSAFAQADPASSEPRLAPRLSLGERDRAGRAPRTLESMGEQSVDVGGAYRITRNLDVTAGVRYSQDRDRLKAIPDGKSDSQAVFVGTQFKF